jgi:hypothetical protein
MNKDFFSSFEDRKKGFAERAGIQGDVRAEVVLNSGRTFIVDRVVEAAENFVHLDAREISDDTLPLSIVAVYHQISFVQFVKPKERMRHAGFVS